MICPLLSAGYEHEAECKEERCAWWDKEARMCALVALTDLLDIVRREGWGTKEVNDA